MTNIRSVIYFGIAIATCPALFASINASDLLANSPFVHARIVRGSSGAAGGQLQQYEFRGICKLDGNTLVNIADNVKKKTYWIKTGESEDDVKVVSYDDESRKVSLLVGSRDYTIDLSKPKTSVAKTDPNSNINRQIKERSDRGKLPQRIRRVRKPGVIPPRPPSINFNQSNFPGVNTINRNTSVNIGSGNSSLPPHFNSDSNVNSNSNLNALTNDKAGSNDNPSTADATDASTGTNDTPPNTVPGSPPSFIPEMPEGLRALIESGATPNSGNSSN